VWKRGRVKHTDITNTDRQTDMRLRTALHCTADYNESLTEQNLRKKYQTAFTQDYTKLQLNYHFCLDLKPGQKQGTERKRKTNR